MADFSGEAAVRYQDAAERREAIRQAWIEAGEPLLSEGSTGQLVEHPFVKMLREHDVLVDRLGASVRKRHRGPEPSAVPGLPAPLEQKIRRVK
jgi:hypothetical protein